MPKPSNKMTAELVLKIKSLIRTGQYYTHQIASMVGVNQGRVSETKHGHWDYLIDQDQKQGRLF